MSGALHGASYAGICRLNTLMGSLVIESNIPGVIAGTLIAAIVAYAIFAYLKPLRGQQSGIGTAFAGLRRPLGGQDRRAPLVSRFLLRCRSG